MSAAAVAAGAMAVESQNVVGYMDVISPSFKLVTPVFTQMGGGTAFTLADVKPVSIENWDFNSDMIHCYSGPNKAFVATYLTAAQAQEIIDDAGLEGVSAVAGWYNFDDVGEWGELGTLRNYNNTPLNAGTGFAVETAIGVIIPTALPEED